MHVFSHRFSQSSDAITFLLSEGVLLYMTVSWRLSTVVCCPLKAPLKEPTSVTQILKNLMI